LGGLYNEVKTVRRNKHREDAQLTRMKSEEKLDNEVIEWTRVLNAEYQWSQSTLSTAGH